MTARTLVVALGDGTGGACLPGDRCSADGHAELCAVLHHLAAIEDGPVPVLEVGRARRAFELALTDAVDAVVSCRRTDHARGGCWFASDPHRDGCGEVLHAAHRVG